MKACILPEAREELFNAAACLDAEAPGLGDQLLEASRRRSRTCYPLANRVVEPPEIRKKNLGRFRYAFLCRVKGGSWLFPSSSICTAIRHTGVIGSMNGAGARPGSGPGGKALH